ncbi:MAG: N-acetylmuramoyl-L-alanine amidase [Candidatus Aureabacteria bacterium]|nr:N-acetylmuramoyl-L-alanine amidase [Candidatus Auribacterota bacterium]
MKRVLTLTSAVMVVTAMLCASAGDPRPFRFGVTFPSPECTTRFTRTRVAGFAPPSGTVAIQGAAVRVYPTGAFVGLVPLREGDNTIEIVAAQGRATQRRLLKVRCVDPITTSPAQPLAIDRVLCEPSMDMILQEGDLVKVRCKGSPGMAASWTLGGAANDLPLGEGEPAAHGTLMGVRGIYRDTYRIRAGDRVKGKRIQFTFRDATGHVVTALSPGRVTLVPGIFLTRGVVGAGGGTLIEEPGGRKVGELPPGTRVNLGGEAGGYWRVLLSRDDRCWLAKESVNVMMGEGGWDPVTAGSPTVTPGRDKSRITLPVSGPVPYRVTYGADGRELQIELFGAAPPKIISGLEANGAVKDVRLDRGPEGCVRLVARLRGDALWGYTCALAGGAIACELNNPPGKSLKRLTVAIDPGHGGRQPGAVSPTGLLEKDVNLAVAQAAAEYLKKKGARVVLTRCGDETVSLAERLGRARAAGADLFVSIHHNSQSEHGDPLASRGGDAFYGIEHSRRLADTMLGSLARSGVRVNGVQREGYAIVLPTEFPAVLVECGYLSHPGDEAELLKKSSAKRVGRAVGRGVEEYVKRCG